MANKKKAVPEKKTVKKKLLHRRNTPADNTMIVSVEFRLGGGELTAKLFRNTGLVASQTWNTTGDKTFSDTRPGDELSITGACSGKAKLSTNRKTTPPSSPSTARNYNQGPILDSLGIN